MEIPPYTGYRTYAMRQGRTSSQGSKEKSTKRTRLGKTRSDRLVYTSAKGYKNSPTRYQKLCVTADRLNGMRRQVNAEI